MRTWTWQQQEATASRSSPEQADEAFRLLSTAAAMSPPKPTSEFWASISCNVDLNAKISEFVKLAHIALVQVPGSVMEERLFSKLAFIRNERRNSMKEEHLNACLVLATQSFWGLHEFPIQAAVQKWFDAKKRRLAEHGKQGWRRQQTNIMEVSSDSDSSE
mmetsp:Transcript_17773/g.49622  ORF Transcript_17773/g.49622 Transcript_17773/m.49622 type:complete len:161 (-) Transcript_17773:91-573(-)